MLADSAAYTDVAGLVVRSARAMVDAQTVAVADPVVAVLVADCVGLAGLVIVATVAQNSEGVVAPSDP